MATAKTTTKKTAPKKAEGTLEAVVYNQKGTKAGTIALPAKVFGVTWNGDLVHQVVTGIMANMRAGTAHTKDRGEVSGGGKKPWKQKGTGRARHGSSRSPIWVGGGTTFGPRSEKDYSKKINKKMRTKALFAVLSKKVKDNGVLFVDTLSLGAIKTKDAAAVLSTFTKIDGFEKIGKNVLVALPEKNEVIEKSFANIPGVTIGLAKDLSALSASTFRHIIFVNPEATVKTLEAKTK